jgi:2-dehydropantoate 2-reductase
MNAGWARPVRVCVVGAGAVGGFLGAQLARGHAQVSALARGATLQALQTRGWGFEHGGTRCFAPVVASADAQDLGPQDVVVIAVKAPALAQVASQIAKLLDQNTVVVPAMNGLPWWFMRSMPALGDKATLESIDPGGQIDRNIPHSRVLGAVVYPACSTPEPGVSRHDSGSRLVFGEPSGANSQRLGAWVGLLQRAGFDAVARDDIRSEVWRKLLGNAAFNPVSLLIGATTDRLIDDPGIHHLFSRLMDEVLAVGRAMGLSLEIVVEERIAQTRRLGAVKTSMLQDAEAGRPVELQAVLGSVIELADRLDVPAPHARAVHALARARSSVLGLI